MPVDENIQFGRAKNAVLSFFEKRLSVPRIYLDVIWGGVNVDVLAINRDGVGDVHAALLFERRQSENFDVDEEWRSSFEMLRRVPAQFKWLVAVQSRMTDGFHVPAGFFEGSFAPDGLGRVGLLSFMPSINAEPAVDVHIKPERFRAFVAKEADEFVRTHEADWEIRPDPIVEETHV